MQFFLNATTSCQGECRMGGCDRFLTKSDLRVYYFYSWLSNLDLVFYFCLW